VSPLDIGCNPIDAHCLVCHSADQQADAVLSRALTVHASKLYARLHYRAELDTDTNR
jgi:hypothetical protein